MANECNATTIPTALVQAIAQAHAAATRWTALVCLRGQNEGYRVFTILNGQSSDRFAGHKLVTDEGLPDAAS